MLHVPVRLTALAAAADAGLAAGDVGGEDEGLDVGDGAPDLAAEDAALAAVVADLTELLVPGFDEALGTASVGVPLNMVLDDKISVRVNISFSFATFAMNMFAPVFGRNISFSF